ncbi:hypothetical protein Tco_0170652, partial [Tanacetum coccineum]
MGFNVVAPPPAQVYSPPVKDLSWTGLPEFADNTVTDYTRPLPNVDATNSVSSKLEGNKASVFEQIGTYSNDIKMPMIKFVKGTSCPSVTKINTNENARKPTVKSAEMYRKSSQSPRDYDAPIIEDWESETESENKACYKCGCFDHLASNCGIWVEKGETWPRDNYKKMIPRAVLLKSSTKPISLNRPVSTAKTTLNVARLKMTSF